MCILQVLREQNHWEVYAYVFLLVYAYVWIMCIYEKETEREI